MFTTGMIHKGVADAGGGLALVADMGMAASYTAHRNSPNNPTDCICRLRISRNGQWSISAAGGAGASITVGSPTGGSWGSPNQAFAGDDYEVSFNNGSTWQRITADRDFETLAQDTTLNDGQVSESSGAFVVIIRRFGTTTPTSTDTVTLVAEANRTDV